MSTSEGTDVSEMSMAVLNLTLTALDTNAASVNSVYSGTQSIFTFVILYMSNKFVKLEAFGKDDNEKLIAPNEGFTPSQVMSYASSIER